MERKGLWAQMNEPATTKDWFLVCLCLLIGFLLGGAYVTALVALAR
jgi:hypothetical protein